MKKLLALLLVCVMAISFVGCDNTQSNTNNENGTAQKNETENKSIYDEDQVLFAAQDRSDIEDDRYTVYAYNYKGELLSSATSSSIGYYAENGLAPAAHQSTGLVGFVDKDGVFQIEPKYDDAAPFSDNGIALIKIVSETDYKSKCGYINSKGEEVTPCIYDSATSFYNCGYAIAEIEENSTDENDNYVKTKMEYHILDKKGKVVVKIDALTENRWVKAVYDDYFVCSTEKGIAMYSYKDKLIAEYEVINYSEETAVGDTFEGLEFKQNSVYKRSLKKVDEFKNDIVKTEMFDGKKFVELKTKYSIESKQVATTQSGIGCGIVENGKTVIPFEYDTITSYGDYFVAIKYTGENTNFDQTFDIYDKDYNKTAENVPYAFSYRNDAYGLNCQLPNGYFQIMIDDEDYETLTGIIDYTGKTVIEPVFGRGIRLCTYEGTGVFYL